MLEIVDFGTDLSNCPSHFCPFCPFSREPDFSRTCGFREKLDNNKALRFRTFPAKSNDSIFHKSPKTLFLCHFGPKCPNFGRTRIFQKNLAPLQTDRQVVRHTGGQTNRKAERQEGRQTDRKQTRQTDRHRKEEMF